MQECLQSLGAPIKLCGKSEVPVLFLKTLHIDRRIDSMPSFSNPALPAGSLILVTGVNGLIGSHVADQVLSYGYKVRGTVRNLKDNSWMVPFFEDKFGVEGIFELIEVREMAVDGSFDEAMKGNQ